MKNQKISSNQLEVIFLTENLNTDLQVDEAVLLLCHQVFKPNKKSLKAHLRHNINMNLKSKIYLLRDKQYRYRCPSRGNRELKTSAGGADGSHESGRSKRDGANYSILYRKAFAISK